MCTNCCVALPLFRLSMGPPDTPLPPFMKVAKVHTLAALRDNVDLHNDLLSFFIKQCDHGATKTKVTVT